MKFKFGKLLTLFFIVVMIAMMFYAYLAVAPYTGAAYVSDLTRASFSMDPFYGEDEIPERVMLVEAPEDAFFHRLNLIHNAKEEIIFTTYSMLDGVATDLIVGALLASADRGVDIHLLNNAVSGKMSAHYSDVLAAHENIQLYFWQPVNLASPQSLNANLHDKYMIVDATFMLLGGRNIGDKYFVSEASDEKISLDREILIYNTDLEFTGSIEEIKDYFLAKVDSKQVSLHEAQMSKENREKYIALYHDYVAMLTNEDFDYDAHTVSVNQITVLTDPLSETKKESRVAYTLMRMLEQSDTVVLQSPYIALTKPHLDEFAQAVKINGKNVTLLTNSLASTANLPAYSAYYADQEKILATGISIYEFQSTRQSIHSKTYLFDGRLTAIGSFNLNERSIRSDTESLVIIDSEAFYELAYAAIEAQMSQSLRVGEGGEYELNDDVMACPVSFKKQALYWTLGHGLRGLRILF